MLKMKLSFVSGAALAALATGCASSPEASPCKDCTCAKAAKPAYIVYEDTTGQRDWKMPFQLGLAGYTMCKKDIDETLEIMRSIDLHNLCVKDFHLKYTATDAEIAAFKAKCAKYGVRPYALGPLYTKSNEEVRKYFEFAKRFGAKVIVGVPWEPVKDKKDNWNERLASRSQLEYINGLVKEFDIRYAIHNHGPQVAKMFPDVAFGYNLVKDLDKRIGFCMDVGWEFGCERDPAETIRKYGDRIYDIHLKNFAVDIPGGRILSKEVPHSFTTVPMPRGKIDYGSVFKALAEVGYDGVCSFEYERDFTNNLGGLAESVGYARGVCDTIRVKAKMQPVPAGANTLTAAEKAEGYTLLFDGKNLPTDLWVGEKEKLERFPQKGWYVQDGALFMRPVSGIADGKWFPLPPEDQKLGGGGSICTKKLYKDFVLKFDFRLTEAANSGIKYFYNEGVNKTSCEEYQVLDPEHPDSAKGKNGNRRVASLYDIFPANAEKVVKPTGHWNSGMIVAKGKHVEHWLNGVKVLEYDRGSKKFRDGVAASKYLAWQDKGEFWGEREKGRLHIQDHTDSTVYYCNLKVKEL